MRKSKRATQIDTMTEENRIKLPTNNLDVERRLAVFGKRATVDDSETIFFSLST